MTFEVFEKWMRKLERKVGKKPMDRPAMIDWFESLKSIPPAAWEEICSHWWWREKAFPNPGDLNDAWAAWLEAHPEKQDRVYSRCSECGGHGGYIVTGLTAKTTAGNTVGQEKEIFVTCTCRPAPMFGPKRSPIYGIQMDQRELLALGCTVLWPTGGGHEPEELIHAPEELTSGIGKQDEIPF